MVFFQLLLAMLMSKLFIYCRNDYKMALASYTEHPKISALFLNKPHVTIFMSN